MKRAARACPRDAAVPRPLDLPLGNHDEPPFLRPEQPHAGARRVAPGRRRRASCAAARRASRSLFVAAASGPATRKVMASERLRVGRVEVRGSHFLSEGEVRELLGPAVGENILGLDIEALKARLRASPWVADATVAPHPARHPAGRDPRARAPGPGRGRPPLPDGRGRRRSSTSTGRARRPSTCRSCAACTGLDGEARRDRAQRAGALLDDLGDLAAEVSEVYVEASGDLRVVLRGRRRGAARRARPLTADAPDVPGPPRRSSRRRLPGRPSTSTCASEDRIYAQTAEALARPAAPVAAAVPKSVPDASAAATPQASARHPWRQPTGTSSPNDRLTEGRLSLAKKKDRYVVGLDIGTHKVCAIVAEITDEGRLDVIGIGQAESKGLRKGVVINLEATVDAIKRVARGGRADGRGRDRLGLRGHRGHPHPRLQLAGRDRGLQQEPGDRARGRARASIEAAKAVSIPMDREILHVLPQEFVVDDQDGIGDPTGHDRHAARGERPRRHLLVHRGPEHRDLREPRRPRGRRTPSSPSSPRPRPA